MRVLQICQKPPQPAIDGGCLASQQLSLNLLNCNVDLKVISMATVKHPFQPDQMQSEYIEDTKFEAQQIDTNISLPEIIINAFGNSSVQKKRFYHESFSNKLEELLKNEDYDLVVFDGLMTCFYLEEVRQNSKAKLIYRSHNIESNIFKQLAENDSNFIKKIYLNLQTKRLKRVEISMWEKADQIWSISSFDSVIIKKALGTEDKVITLVFSIKKKVTEDITKKNTLFHLGAMDWKPNIDGVIWFTKEVWPKVVQKQPSAVLNLGGKSIGNVRNKLVGENIIIHNVVKVAGEFYDKYEIMIVPVKAGSGIRIKIIQALARGKIIVSTKQGVMGIPAVHKEHMIVCDSSEEMSKELIELMNNENAKKILSQNARKLFDINFDIDKVSAQLKTILETHN